LNALVAGLAGGVDAARFGRQIVACVAQARDPAAGVVARVLGVDATSTRPAARHPWRAFLTYEPAGDAVLCASPATRTCAGLAIGTLVRLTVEIVVESVANFRLGSALLYAGVGPRPIDHAVALPPCGIVIAVVERLDGSARPAHPTLASSNTGGGDRYSGDTYG
jgi:hypothetical protein